jgi:NAD(P)-dependent dehydrogenase (short-subunit alcohol dehydrogenase family)
MSETRTAFVTGASRGIGKVIAVALAEAGFDVAITARTVEPGESREHSSTVARSDTSPLPGSLRETAALIEKAGRRTLMVPADLTDRAALGAAATVVLERWGAPDVIVHNARYIGAGHMDTLLGAPIGVIERHMEGNFFAPLVLNQLLLPAMIERGRGGLVVHLTSGSAFSNPHAPAGQGGWGISYGSTKAALHRVAGILALELAPYRIHVVNVDPGYIATERIAQDMAGFGFAADGEPPEVVGAVVAWLATNDTTAMSGDTVSAQPFCRDHHLLAGWDGPKIRAASSSPDLAASRLAEENERYTPR